VDNPAAPPVAQLDHAIDRADEETRRVEHEHARQCFFFLFRLSGGVVLGTDAEANAMGRFLI
jgi:hypothetical protein